MWANDAGTRGKTASPLLNVRGRKRCWENHMPLSKRSIFQLTRRNAPLLVLILHPLVPRQDMFFETQLIRRFHGYGVPDKK